MGTLPSRRAFVGVQPQRVAIGSSLSPSLYGSIAPAAAHARAILEGWLASAPGN
jgi:hydrogenase maturation protease